MALGSAAIARLQEYELGVVRVWILAKCTVLTLFRGVYAQPHEVDIYGIHHSQQR